MSNHDNMIEEEFAKQLLIPLYKLRSFPLHLNEIIFKIDDDEKRTELMKIINDMENIIANKLILPIYRYHPSLENANEPKNWLGKENSSSCGIKGSPNFIDKEFAKQLLTALYKLDNPGNRLVWFFHTIAEGEIKKKLYEIIEEIMSMQLFDLLVPIYRCHRSLGRASEPGDWFKKEDSSN